VGTGSPALDAAEAAVPTIIANSRTKLGIGRTPFIVRHAIIIAAATKRRQSGDVDQLDREF